MKKTILLGLSLVTIIMYGCSSGLENSQEGSNNRSDIALEYQINEWEEHTWELNNTKKLVDDLFSNKLFVEYVVNNFVTWTAFVVSTIWWVNLDDKTWWDMFSINEDLLVYIRTSWRYETSYSTGYVSVCDKNNKFFKEIDLWSGQKAWTCEWDVGEYEENIPNQEFVHDTIIDIVLEEKTTWKKTTIQWSDADWIEKMLEMMPVGY